jgi:beta-RFAP synthase
MVRVRTGSRLHFGLLSFPAEALGSSAARPQTVATRWFGGVGLMVEMPALQLLTEPSAAWSADGPLSDRALTFARRFAQSSPDVGLQPRRISIEQAPPEHRGLGTGTQLGMAVARALSLNCGLGKLSAAELALRVGRGARSSLGIHGFAQGGFLVEAGKRQAAEVSPLVARLPFPETWRLVLIFPPCGQGLSGADEQEAFRRLQSQPLTLATTDTLCRLVLLGMLPALAECDFEAFSDALYDFNVRVGTAFAPIQGGSYAHPRIVELVTWMRRQGIRGVGQSSWGPAVFALVADEEQAVWLAERIRQTFALDQAQVTVTKACNGGAETQEFSV